MSKQTIYIADLSTLRQLENFFEATMTRRQLDFLETMKERSPFWDVKSPWNKNFILGVVAATGRFHHYLDAGKGKQTRFLSGGLAKKEFEEIAEKLGIEKSKMGKTKEAIWTQIKRKISPDISKEELKWIFAGLAGILTDEDVAWLKNNISSWEDSDMENEDWVKKNTATITDMEILIEDIIGMIVNRVVTNHYPKLTRMDLLAIEKKFGIVPPSSQLFSRGVIKLRIIKYIQDDVNGLLRQPSITRELLVLKSQIEKDTKP